MIRLVDIVSSRTKAELLRILFGLRQPETHMRELVRQSGLSLGAIQQELRHLTTVGLVLARKDGNRLYFRANPGHPVHNDLRSLVLKTDGLAGLLERALDVPEVSVAFVFGSVARGEATAESDIDLMVIGEIGLRRLASLLSGLTEQIGREINPHVISPEDFQERKQQRDHFIASVTATPKLFVKGSEDELKAMGG